MRGCKLSDLHILCSVRHTRPIYKNFWTNQGNFLHQMNLKLVITVVFSIKICFVSVKRRYVLE